MPDRALPVRVRVLRADATPSRCQVGGDEAAEPASLEDDRPGHVAAVARGALGDGDGEVAAALGGGAVRRGAEVFGWNVVLPTHATGDRDPCGAEP